METLTNSSLTIDRFRENSQHTIEQDAQPKTVTPAPKGNMATLINHQSDMKYRIKKPENCARLDDNICRMELPKDPINGVQKLKAPNTMLCLNVPETHSVWHNIWSVYPSKGKQHTTLGMKKMRALVARINVPSVHRYLLMLLSLALGILTCTFLS